jgi:hypothetical protein
MSDIGDQETESSVNAGLARLEEARLGQPRTASAAGAPTPVPPDIETTIARAHDDLVRHVRRVLREADAHLAALERAAARSDGVDRERFETAIAAIRTERDLLDRSARALRDAPADAWARTRDQFELAMRGLRFLREKSRGMID